MKKPFFKIEYLLLLIYSILTKFFVSINSIRFNEVFTDPDHAIFYSIGKALMHGKVLYKDVFDHKTPYIYFANAIASLLEKNHLGLFIIEVILMTITLIYVYKISKIYFSNTISVLASFYIGYILNINFITFGYSRTEAYAIAFLVPAVYIFAKYFETTVSYAAHEVRSNAVAMSHSNNVVASRASELVSMDAAHEVRSNAVVASRASDNVGAMHREPAVVADITHQVEFNTREMFYIGILAGLTFMTNIRAAILFVPFAVAVLIKLIINKKYKNILMIFIFGLLGVVVSILPYLVYAIVTDSMSDAAYAIVTTNINYANSTVDTGKGAIETALVLMKEHIIFYIFLLVSFVSFIMLKFDKYFKISVLTSFVITFIYVTFSNRTYVYYLVILMPYMLSVYYLVVKSFAKKNNEKINMLASLTFFVIFLTLSLITNKGISNRYINHSRRAEKINNCALQYFGDKKDIKVLSYGFLPEVYVYMNEVPDYKYFMTPNVSYNVDSTSYDEQYKYLLNRDPDFVVYREYTLNTGIPSDMVNQIHYILENSYELLDTIRTNEYEGIFYIFAKK